MAMTEQLYQFANKLLSFPMYCVTVACSLTFKLREKDFGFKAMAGNIRDQGTLDLSWRAELQLWCVGYSY